MLGHSSLGSSYIYTKMNDKELEEVARQLKFLAPVCGWFTEGFNTLDLKEAKALLDELRA